MKKRKSIRFNPEENNIVTLLYNVDDGEKIGKTGFLRDESYTGCCVIFRKPFPLKKGENVQINIGKIQNIVAEIKWIKDIDEILVKVGLSIRPPN